MLIPIIAILLSTVITSNIHAHNVKKNVDKSGRVAHYECVKTVAPAEQAV